MIKGKNQSGFTLVEICVALMVLGLGLVSVLSVFAVGIQWSSEFRQDSLAPGALATVLDDARCRNLADYVDTVPNQNQVDYQVDAGKLFMNVAVEAGTGDFANTYRLRVAYYVSDSDRATDPVDSEFKDPNAAAPNTGKAKGFAEVFVGTVP